MLRPSCFLPSVKAAASLSAAMFRLPAGILAGSKAGVAKDAKETNSMTCPVCGSPDVKEACCGDTTSWCRRCGFRFEGGSGAACPLNREPEKSESNECELAYRPLTDEQLWGG